MTPEQCRAARKKPGWTIEKLAIHAGLATHTVGDFERRKTDGSEQTVRSLRRAFLEAGVELDAL